MVDFKLKEQKALNLLIGRSGPLALSIIRITSPNEEATTAGIVPHEIDGAIRIAIFGANHRVVRFFLLINQWWLFFKEEQIFS